MILENYKNFNYSRFYMINIFLPHIKTKFYQDNPHEYINWGGNCCRQAAILGCQMLNKLMPDYEWTAWEGRFMDVEEGNITEYVHAWSFGKAKDKKTPENKRRIFMDISSTSKKQIFEYVESNKHPKTECRKDMLEMHRERIDWASSLEDCEYYTGMKALDLIKFLFGTEFV